MENDSIERTFNFKKREQDGSQTWKMFGSRLPRSEIVFFCQVILIYIVVGVSLYNLTQGTEPTTLWNTLLASGVAYLLPAPQIYQKASARVDAIQ